MRWSVSSSSAQPRSAGIDFWKTLAASTTAGLATAAFAALLARWVASRYTRKWDAAKTRRDRDEAAAGEFYRAYGKFFAAWKFWDDSRKDVADGDQAAWSDRVGALSRVADAEGVLESFLVRLTLERELDRQDLDRLWCFRRGYKQLRYSVRGDQPLLWWRAAGPGKDAGFRDYRAFKRLSVGVAALLVPAPEEGAERPSADVALRNLEYVTGSGEELETHYASILQERPAADRDAQGSLWVAVAEALDMPPAQRRTEHRSLRSSGARGLQRLVGIREVLHAKDPPLP